MNDLELRQVALQFSMNRNTHTGNVKDVIKEAQAYYEFLLGVSKEKNK